MISNKIIHLHLLIFSSMDNPFSIHHRNLQKLAIIGRIRHNNQLRPHRHPFTPGWREAIVVKCLAQGHKHHGRSEDSNSHSDDSAIRTQIRCTKPLGHGAPRNEVYYLLLHFSYWTDKTLDVNKRQLRPDKLTFKR